MKKLLFLFFIFGVLISPLCSSRADAKGLGLYLSYRGLGSTKFDFNNTDTGGGSFNADSNHFGIGIVYDTTVAKKGFYNYRSNIGYEKSNYKSSSAGGIKMESLVVTQDFGFGIYQSRPVRLWVAPELLLSYTSGKFDQGSLKTHVLTAGVGPVIGINYNMKKKVTVSLKTGYLYSLSWGATESDTYCYNYSSSSNCADDNFTSRGGQFVVNIAVIFRFDDNWDELPGIR